MERKMFMSNPPEEGAEFTERVGGELDPSGEIDPHTGQPKTRIKRVRAKCLKLEPVLGGAFVTYVRLEGDDVNG